MERRFFKGGNEESRKMATVRWEDLEVPVNLGGLGFGNIQIKNLRLLAKWWWKCLAAMDPPLWKKVVMSINDNTRTFPTKVDPLHGSWSEIAKECLKIPLV